MGSSWGNKGTGFEIRVLGAARELRAVRPAAGLCWSLALTSDYSPSLLPDHLPCQKKQEVGVEPAPDGNLGDLRAGLSLASPSARLPLAQFPYWYLKGTPVSLLSCSPILQIRRLSLTHYSPIICLLPTVLLRVPSSAVLLLKKAVYFQSFPQDSFKSHPLLGHPLSASSTDCPGQSLGAPFISCRLSLWLPAQGIPWPPGGFAQLGNFEHAVPYT